MKSEDILKLINAGYTKEDIAAMDAPVNEPKVEPKVEAEQAPAEKPKTELELLTEQVAELTKLVMESKEEPKPEPKVEEPKEVTPPAESELMKEIKRMREAMQASNIINSQQAKQMTSNDVIASLITGKKEE